MKIEKLIAWPSVVLLAALSAQAQGTFQNLNFEQANPISAGNPLDPYSVTAASALPYWTVTYYGEFQQTDINYNYPSTGAPAVTLLGQGDAYWGPPIDGNYSVLIQGGIEPYPQSASISQTGLIPAGMQSLLFEVPTGYGSPASALEVLVGAQSLALTEVGTGSDYTLYGASISAWAGQTEDLTLTALPPTSGQNNWEIDDISFSPNAVPEPSTWALLLMAGAAFGVRRWRSKGS
jgi:PEP-CTERM motif